MIKTALILSAGAGTRLRPLSQELPKPLFPVLNKSMLEWWAEFLASAGVKRAIINTYYQRELMLERIQCLADSFCGRLEIIPSPEGEVLGTAGGILAAAELLGSGDFLVVNADIFTDFQLAKLALKHLANPGRLATLGLLEDQAPANVSLAAYDNIVAFRSPSAVEGEIARRTYCGIMALSPQIFNHIPQGETDIIEVFNQCLTSGQCFAAGHSIAGWTYDPALWEDMGTPDKYWNLNRLLAAGRTIVHSTAQVLGQLNGWNVIGKGAIIENGATVENSVIWPKSIISAGSVVKDAVAAGLVPTKTEVRGGIYCEYSRL